MDAFKKQQSPKVLFNGALTSLGIYSIWTILFFYYAFKKEVGVPCFAEDGSNFPVTNVEQQFNVRNVAYDYDVVLKLYAFSMLADCLREIVGAIYYKTGIADLAKIRNILNLAHLVQFSAMIILHVYRLRHTGKVCAGDFLSAEELAKPENQTLYLDERGSFLYGLLIFYWVCFGLIGCCCVTCCIVIGAKARS